MRLWKRMSCWLRSQEATSLSDRFGDFTSGVGLGLVFGLCMLDNTMPMWFAVPVGGLIVLVMVKLLKDGKDNELENNIRV